MKLYHASGLIGEMNVGDEARDILMQNAISFLRAGGVVSLSEWSEMDSSERAALVKAGDLLWTERAVCIGMAIQGQEGIAKVISGIDGGDVLAKMKCNETIQRVASKLSGMELQ